MSVSTLYGLDLNADPYALNSLMEFDHVIRVTDAGAIQDGFGVYAPSLLDDELDDAEWTLLTGYSGQHGYAGPIMHASEFIGGGMARDILETPGVYVALVALYTTDADGKPIPEGDGDYIGGWAIAAHSVGGVR